jgi:hypothetical protein
MSRDIQRLSDVVRDITKTGRISIRGTVFGPKHREVVVYLKCRRPDPKATGGCASFEIERSGPGVAAFGFKKQDGVGNISGFTHQMSRDIVRAWGCEAAKEVGFDGPPRPKRKRSRR